MKMRQQQFRIGQLADMLGVERFVIRFWEKEFGIKASRSDGGQRFYTQKDYDHFQKIKTLLYNKEYTIAGAKKALKSKINSTHYLSSTKIAEVPKKVIGQEIVQELKHIKNQLCKLRELL